MSVEYSNIQRHRWIALAGCYLDLHMVLAEFGHIIINDLLDCGDVKVCYQLFWGDQNKLFERMAGRYTWEEKVDVV